MSTSPLQDVHAELGANFTDFAGWQMPLRYGSELAEHKAVRESAGLFDLSHMAEIAVTGPGALAALNYAFVGNIGTVKPGRARYTMLCDANGGVLDDLVVYHTGENEYLVVANAANHDVVLAELTERAGGFDAEVTDRTFETALIALQGPESAAIIAEHSDTELDTLKYYAARPATVAGLEVLLARTGYTGEDGFELYLPNAQAPELWRVLAAHEEVLPCGLASRDTLRLEAGMPLYGNELGTGTTPADAGLGRVVRFDKEGDFVGRQALADAEQTRKLVALRGTGRRAPRTGYPVLANGAPIGEITSGALSPTLGYPIALAYVELGNAEEGTELAVDIRGRSTEPVTVVALPFYRRGE
ncbi:glycine cleavage system aminomethyltransferase GcvT [Sciscionella sp. SE31]|uniref:glycine cleavage system aminomethyltransferase GcvT n=1 Tax=Sciscionella sediminilitoris TaxID=1445613 RepID=UPI0004DEEF45